MAPLDLTKCYIGKLYVLHTHLIELRFVLLP